MGYQAGDVPAQGRSSRTVTVIIVLVSSHPGNVIQR